MDAGERLNHPIAGRIDLVSLAIELGVGHRDVSRRELDDDRNLATHARDGGAQTGKTH